MARKSKKGNPTSIRLTDEMISDLTAAAEADHRTLSDYIRLVLERHLECLPERLSKVRIEGPPGLRRSPEPRMRRLGPPREKGAPSRTKKKRRKAKN